MRADVRGFSLQNMLKNSSLTLQCTTDEVQSLIDDVMQASLFQFMFYIILIWFYFNRKM